MNPQKSLVNFDACIDGQPCANARTNYGGPSAQRRRFRRTRRDADRGTGGAADWFPWCGLLINARTFEIRPDFSRYYGIFLRDTMTIEWTVTPGLSLCRKMKRFAGGVIMSCRGVSCAC